MDKRQFDRLDSKLSRLAFGCMRLPKTSEGKIDYPAAQEMVDYAMAHGLNYFDTAYVYHDQDSENFVGQALKKYDRSSFYVATKLPLWLCETKEDMERIFNEHLERLQMDYIDFYLLHSTNRGVYPKWEKLGAYEFMEQKKKEGKIRNIGFSFHADKELLEEILSSHHWDFCQLQINYLDWHNGDAKELYELTVKHDVPVMVMEPVRGGYLSSFAPAVEAPMKAYNPDLSVSAWALRWVASLPNVAIVLSGMSDMQQMQDNVATFTNFKPMNDEEYKVIDTVLSELDKIKPIPCTGCRYCMDCTNGVDIPAAFAAYNDYKKTENKQLILSRYFNANNESKLASHCIACGACTPQCPQHINIPEELARVTKELEALKG